MEDKFCNGCQQSKSVDAFWKKHGAPQARCKQCQKDYHKLHYKDNKKTYVDRARIRNKKISDILKEHIHKVKDVPCQDCGIKYPHYVMDFDHRPGEKKLFSLAEAQRIKVSLDKVKEEILKCDVVCSNCHRIRTYNRRVTA